MAFIFKEIPDSVLESYHSALKKTHDSLGSMVMEIDNLLNAPDVSDQIFYTSNSDFVQSLTAPAPAVPKCIFISKDKHGLGHA